MKVRYFIVAAVAFVVVVYFAGELFVTRIPPRSKTSGNMFIMKRRILRYASIHNAAPTSLDQLPLIEQRDNDVVDAWHRPILWQLDGDKVTLISYGRDGQPGGVDDDADIIGVFSMKDDMGQWAEELSEWRTDPLHEARQ